MEDYPARMTHGPLVMGDKPCIRGLRVTVGTVVGLVLSNRSNEAIMALYPYLEPEDKPAAAGCGAGQLDEGACCWSIPGKSVRKRLRDQVVILHCYRSVSFPTVSILPT